MLYFIKESLYLSSRGELIVEFFLARVLKKGGYGKRKRYTHATRSHRLCLQQSDLDVMAKLEFLNIQDSGYFRHDGTIYIRGEKSSQCLEEILRTGRCFWGGPANGGSLNHVSIDAEHCITNQGLATPVFKWDLLPNACQQFNMLIDNKPAEILFLDQAWYFDQERKVMGIMDTDIPTPLLQGLLSAPAVPLEAIKALSDRIKKVTQDPTLLPSPVSKPVLLTLSNAFLKYSLIFKTERIQRYWMIARSI